MGAGGARGIARDQTAYQGDPCELDPGQRGVLKEKLEQQGLGGQAKRLD